MGQTAGFVADHGLSDRLLASIDDPRPGADVHLAFLFAPWGMESLIMIFKRRQMR